MRVTRTQQRIRRALSLVVVYCVLGLLAACSESGPRQPQIQYVTRYGLGPDKWATAWLLTRRVDPTGKLTVVESKAALPDGVVFDEPSSPFRRMGNRAAFEVTKAHYGLSDPTLNTLAELVHEIEINFWNSGAAPSAAAVETAFRNLQYEQGRADVSPECYLAFFDRVYEVLADRQSEEEPIRPERLQLGCGELIKNAQRAESLVPEVPLVDVLSAMAAGRKVIFVDVREADEFAEAHIPSALNIPIRDASAMLKQRLSGADYVVSYCVKDFRGFEMAKALAELGVKKSVIMRPYGIKGWISGGLPVVGTKALSESEAQAALSGCLAKVEDCSSAKGAI